MDRHFCLYVPCIVILDITVYRQVLVSSLCIVYVIIIFLLCWQAAQTYSIDVWLYIKIHNAFLYKLSPKTYLEKCNICKYVCKDHCSGTEDVKLALSLGDYSLTLLESAMSNKVNVFTRWAVGFF